MDCFEAIIRLKALNVMFGPFEAVNVAIECLEENIKEQDDGK